MSPLAEEYRRRVKVAEAMAEATQDQTAEEAYLEVAERWRRLAQAIAACGGDAKRGVRLGRDIRDWRGVWLTTHRSQRKRVRLRTCGSRNILTANRP